MARRPGVRTSRRRAAQAAAGTDSLARLVTAALEEAAVAGWAQVSHAAVAERAGLSLAETLAHAPTASHLLARIADYFDREAFKGVDGVDPSQSVKDRLFDLLMRRYDVLQRHRAGVLALMKGLRRDPAAAAMLIARMSRSLAATLAAAGLTPHGLMGCARVMGLKAVHVAALRAWRRDDTADMAKTMAALDRALAAAERLARFADERGFGAQEKAGDPA